MFYLTVFSTELLVDWLSYIRPVADLNVTNWNPQAALHLYFLLITRRSIFPIALAGIAANVLVRSTNLIGLVHFEPIISALLFMAAAVVCGKIIDIIKIFEQSGEFLKFLVFCLVVAAVHSIVVSVLYVTVGELAIENIIYSVVAMFIGDTTGLIILFPFLLLARTRGTADTLRGIFGKVEIQGALVVLGVFFYFLATLDIANPLRFTYLVAIPIFFIAFRFDIRDVMGLTLIVQIMLAVAFIYRRSPFERVMEAQFMLLVIASSIVYLSLIIFERREFQNKARLKRKERQLATMSGIILHEIAQPVTALGNLSVIQMKELEQESAIDKEKLRIYAKNIHSEIVRVRQILVQIKKSINNEEEGAITPVEIISVVRSVLDMISSSAAALGVNMELSTKSDSIITMIPSQNLSISVRNIIINAIQSASKSEEKWCRIDIHQSADFCFIDFSDSGEVISSRHINEIFEYGYKESDHGLGMGLSIARDLLEIAGSRIFAYHGQQLKFRIVLKVANAK